MKNKVQHLLSMYVNTALMPFQNRPITKERRTACSRGRKGNIIKKIK